MRKGRKVLSYQDVRDRGIRYSRVHLARLEAQGLFPRRIRLGPGTIGWFEDEIDGMLDEAAAKRDEEVSV